MNRWAKSGGLARVFAQLQQAPIIRVQLEAVALDSTIVTVHPEGTGAFQQMARQPSAGRVVGEPPRCIWLPRMRERPCRLPCRQAHDAPEGRKRRHRFGKRPSPIPLLRDRAYEGDETRQLAVELG